MSVPILYNLVQKIIAGPLHARVEELLILEIPDQESNHILDVGCGLGNYSSLFKKAKYTGLDLDPEYIQHARNAFSRSNVSFLIGDAVSPPLFTRSFTHIFSVGLYHHLSDDATVLSIERLSSLLTEGGSLVIFDAVYPRTLNVLGYILRRLDRGKHVRSFKEYEKLLRFHFNLEYVQYHTAGVLNFISYKIVK